MFCDFIRSDPDQIKISLFLEVLIRMKSITARIRSRKLGNDSVAILYFTALWNVGRFINYFIFLFISWFSLHIYINYNIIIKCTRHIRTWLYIEKERERECVYVCVQCVYSTLARQKPVALKWCQIFYYCLKKSFL